MSSRSTSSSFDIPAAPAEAGHVFCSLDQGALATVTKSKHGTRVGRALRSRRWAALHRSLLTACILATTGLVFWVGVDVARLLMEGAWVAVVLGVVVGAFAIDFVTGFVHFACDRFGDPETPVLGPLLIKAFRDHHDHPHAILEHDWVETNGEPCVLTTFALIALACFVPETHSQLGAATATGVWTMAALGAFANQAHKWAHMPNAPRVVRLFQRAGLILRPGEHGRHHDAPHQTAYCISTGWMNPLLERLGLWSWLERSWKGTT
ncbi:MAG: fatty acid desaturase CarF family protein [Myxococcales bacterium]